MDNTKKWVLTTKKIVEDELYKFGKKCHYEHLCHSFIVDPNDKTFIKEGIFTQHEIEEIREYKSKPLPAMPLDLLRYLNNFNVTSTSELRGLIFKTEQWNNAYDTQKHFDYDWIRNTVYNLVREFETDALADKTNTETWFMVHVWSLIDRCFESIKGMRVVRGESSCLASSIRKNRNRTGASVKQMERKIMGRRGDISIRRLDTEYGCGEAGRLYSGPNGTKLLQERGLKTPKMMKDQFDNLCTLVESKESKIRSLETIGFIHAGLFMLLLRLDSPAGYICRISRSKMLSVPSTIGEFGKKVLPIIMLAWKAKKIVSNTILMIDKNDDDDDPLETLQRSCDNTLLPSRHEICLPTCFDTPNKDKNDRNKKGIPSNKNKMTPKRTSKKGI